MQAITVAPIECFAVMQYLSYYWHGVFNADIGLALRGTFIVDRQGTVVYKVVNAIPDARDQDEYRKVLASL